MSKKIKKVDPKAVAKAEVMGVVEKALVDAGYVVVSGAEYGMTAGTVIVDVAGLHVQIKPIAPKAGVERYEIVEDEVAE